MAEMTFAGQLWPDSSLTVSPNHLQNEITLRLGQDLSLLKQTV